MKNIFLLSLFIVSALNLFGCLGVQVASRTNLNNRVNQLCKRGDENQLRANKEIVFPTDSKIFNVHDFGAKGDGIVDDTNAIQSALNKAQNSASILYIPNGTYLVSKPLYFYRWIMIQGQSCNKTIIKLKDNSVGYSNPKHPSWVLFASPKGTEQSEKGDNMAFSQYVMNLTVDTGTSNPGAIGVMFISNNGGGLRDVAIRSGDGQGVIGLDLRKSWDGPALYKNISVNGFDVGIHVRNETYSSDFENVTLVGQRVAGIINESHPLTFRKLISSLKVPTILNKKSGYFAGLVVVLDSSLTGLEKPEVAIQNDDGGAIFLQNTSIKGYNTDLTGPQYKYKTAVSNIISSHPFVSLSAKPIKLRDKRIADTPELPWEPMSSWVSVANYKNLVANGDWAPAIQAAIDSNKTTVYFPHGKYWVGSTIRVRGKVRILQGISSTIVAGRGAFKNKPLFQIEPGTPDTVFIDRLIMENELGDNSVTMVEHASPANLVVTNSRGMSYRNANTVLGDLYVEDMVGGPWNFAHPQKAWFRQLNVEGSMTKVINHKADIWIQGFKSEGLSTLIDNRSPEAKTTVFGGLDYPVGNGNRSSLPSFWNHGGSMTVVIANFWTNIELVREELNGVTRSLKKPSGERYTFYSSVN